MARLGAGLTASNLSVETRIVDHQALQQSHGSITALNPQQIQHVTYSHTHTNNTRMTKYLYCLD